jgi:acylphosphatase
MRIRLHVWIHGYVQGVSFRSGVRSLAESKGLDGWIMNLPDGSVEAVFQGNEEGVEEVLGFCRRGPAAAEVERIEVRKEPLDSGLRGFGIRH